MGQADHSDLLETVVIAKSRLLHMHMHMCITFELCDFNLYNYKFTNTL